LDRRSPVASPRSPLTWALYLRNELSQADDAGYFGPSSALWRLNRESVLAIGLVRAILLQLAHPWVALATASAAELITFGSRAQADRAAARIRRVHTRINGRLSESAGRWPAGTPYTAEDVDALCWVLATLGDTTLLIYETVYGSLPDHVSEAYLADTARLGEFLGIPVNRPPRTRRELSRYLADRIADGTVAVGDVGRRVATDLSALRVPLWQRVTVRPWLRFSLDVAAATLPAAIRAQYGDALPNPRRRLLSTGARLARTVLPRLPVALRTDPIARAAIRRAEGALLPLATSPEPLAE
jgi:uncharacterized protein (DUF2236 family)